MRVVLNPFLLSGKLGPDTPIIVYVEIASALGIKLNQIDWTTFVTIYNIPHTHPDIYPTLEIEPNTPFQQLPRSYLKVIARFVNADETWDIKTLGQAWDFLVGYLNTTNYSFPEKIVGGRPSLKAPYQCSALLLYRFLSWIGVRLFADCTYQQMADLLLLYVKRQTSIYTQSLMTLTAISSPSVHLSVIALAEQFVGKHGPAIETSKISFRNNTHILPRTFPRNHNEAIILAAINYQVDITRSVVPLEEYKQLKLHDKHRYQPVDEKMRVAYLRNLSLFNLARTFNPRIPREGYRDDTLLAYFAREGLVGPQAYNELCDKYQEETFYAGWHPEIDNRVTLITQTNVDELKNDDILCYGVWGRQLTAITQTEISDLFLADLAFTNIFREGKKLLTANQVKRLKILASPELQVTIRKVEDHLAIKSKEIQEFVREYNKASPVSKQLIVNMLQELLDLGMTMRGWSPGMPYPLNAIPVDGIAVEEATSARLLNFTTKYMTDTVETNRVRALPLMLYRNGYINSTQPEDGLTIGARLKIVAAGEAAETIRSCIRSSSNWIVSSAYRYLELIDKKPAFAIDKLHMIY